MEKEITTFFEKDITSYETLEDYYAANDDEMWSYRRESPQNTGLGIDIFVDDDMSYKWFEHPKWVYFRNNYESVREYLPMLIDKQHPRIPLINPNIKISLKDIEQIKNFIIKNYSGLIKISNGGTARLYPISESVNPDETDN